MPRPGGEYHGDLHQQRHLRHDQRPDGPTTLPGQVTATSPRGRSVNETGYPIRICELLVALEGQHIWPGFPATTPPHSPGGPGHQKAFEVQQQKQGFALVEVLSTCSVNWGMAPVKAMQWLEENMIPYYPWASSKTSRPRRVNSMAEIIIAGFGGQEYWFWAR